MSRVPMTSPLEDAELCWSEGSRATRHTASGTGKPRGACVRWHNERASCCANCLMKEPMKCVCGWVCTCTGGVVYPLPSAYQSLPFEARYRIIVQERQPNSLLRVFEVPVQLWRYSPRKTLLL